MKDAQGQPAAGIARCLVAAVEGAAALEAAAAGRKIGPGTEGTAGAGDDDGTHLVVGIGPIERVDQLRHHAGREGVELVRPVEGDGQDAVVDVKEDRFVVHAGRLRGVDCNAEHGLAGAGKEAAWTRP